MSTTEQVPISSQQIWQGEDNSIGVAEEEPERGGMKYYSKDQIAKRKMEIQQFG